MSSVESCSSNSLSSGKIVYLAGPSSMGKSSYSKELVAKGWLHLERDQKFFVKVIGGIQAAKEYASSLQVIKDCLSPYPDNVKLFCVIHSDIKPDLEPKNLEAFKKAQKHLRTYLSKNDAQILDEIDIEILKEALKVAKTGQNVIIDDVSLLEEYKNIELKQDGQQDIYHFKGSPISIEERVKYLPIGKIMQNIMRRNQNPLDGRDPLMVLHQYGDFFKAGSKNSKEPIVDTLKTDELKNWIARAVLIRFVDILSETHYFFHEGTEGIDNALKERVAVMVDRLHKNEQLINQYENSNSPKDKAELREQLLTKLGLSHKITEKELNKLIKKEKEKISGSLANWVTITDEIRTTTKLIFEKMKISPKASEVNLTFYSRAGAHPFIIK